MTASSEDTRTRLERTEEELSWAGLAVAGTIRTAEFAVIALIALLVCPPLLILTVVVVVPLIALAVVIGAVASVIALPVLVVRHLHRHRVGARAQAKLYVKRDRTVAPPR
jgi:uncharacterized membrane protein